VWTSQIEGKTNRKSGTSPSSRIESRSKYPNVGCITAKTTRKFPFGTIIGRCWSYVHNVVIVGRLTESTGEYRAPCRRAVVLGTAVLAVSLPINGKYATARRGQLQWRTFWTRRRYFPYDIGSDPSSRTENKPAVYYGSSGRFQRRRSPPAR